MIARIIEWSIRWRMLVISMTLGIAVIGVYAALQLPIDAVPDVTSNQVQINSVAPAFTPEEMEQYVTAPLEVALSSLPYKEEIRSVSQFGLSQVTVIFSDVAGHLPRAAAGPRAADRRAARTAARRDAGAGSGLARGWARSTSSRSSTRQARQRHSLTDLQNDARLVHQAAAPHGAWRHRSQQLRRS